MKNLISISTASKSGLFRNLKHLFVLLIAVVGISLSINAAPSTLDPSFGNLGKVISSPDGADTFFGYDMALTSDGKIIVAGISYSHLGFFVARYNSNGSLDTAFGNNGWTTAAFDGSNAESYSYKLDVQPDGKIVVGGYVRFSGQQYDFAVMRFNAEGSLDTAFGVNGKARISFVPELFSTDYRELLSDIKVTSNGKIVVSGYAELFSSSTVYKFILTRLNADGSLDTTFGTNGKVADTQINAVPRTLVVLPDDSIIVSGNHNQYQQSTRIAAKYSPSGVRDWIYSEQDNTADSGAEGFYGSALQPDGKIILVGRHASRISAIRLNGNGTLDTSFNSPTFFATGKNLSVAVQPNGKIVANFSTRPSYVEFENSFNLVRYNSDGSLDSGFGTNGIIINSATSGTDYGKKVIVQPNGKILIGGYSKIETSSTTRYYLTMMRYLGDFAAPNNPLFDYDGDGKADISVFRPSNGAWYINQSSNGFSGTLFGISTDKIVPADYDGDGKTDVAVFRPSNGSWYYLRSSDGTFSGIQWGQNGDIPIPGNYDGDGKADINVFRPSNGFWYRLNSSNNQYVSNAFGQNGDIPLFGDFNGDGRDDLAVFRPSAGQWYIARPTGVPAQNFDAVTFGFGTDIPVPADYDGDGKTDVAVFRPSNGSWYRLNSSNGAFFGVAFGANGDIPVAADYDGDGKTDVAVFRPSNGAWYQMLSTNGFSAQLFGFGTDRPTPSAYNP